VDNSRHSSGEDCLSSFIHSNLWTTVDNLSQDVDNEGAPDDVDVNAP